MKTLKQIREASGGKEAYQKFFNSLLKKFGVSSPSELEGKKKKDFFDAIDKGWDGDNEPKEKGESVKEAKLKAGKGNIKGIGVDLDATDYDGGEKQYIKDVKKRFKVTIKMVRYGAELAGKKQDIVDFLLSDMYGGVEDRDIEDMWPELIESSDDFEDDYDETDDKGNYSGVDESLGKPKTQPVTNDTEAETVDEAKWGPAKRGKPIRGAKLGKSYPVMDQGQRRKIIAIAKKHSGNMQRAMKEIEKLKKGMTDNPEVMVILRQANESLDLLGTGDTGSSESVNEAKEYMDEAVDCDGRLLGFKAATRRASGEKQKGTVEVDRRTKGYKEAQLRREKAKAKREEKRKAEEFAKKYPKIDYNQNTDEENEALMKKLNKSFVPETAANAASTGGVDMAPNAGKKKKKFKDVKRDNY